MTGAFLKAGHFPTLVAALLYFDISFMTWVLLGPLAPFLRESLGLTATEQGLVTALPLLGGSLFRPLMGALGERIGGRRAAVFGMVVTIAALALGWWFATTVAHLYVLGLLLGVAGASFAVALPLASRWYPPEYQGLAMGIAGAGNSGTLLATLFAPRLAERFGWAATLGLAMLPMLAVLAVFLLMAKDSPRPAAASTRRDYVAVLADPDTLWLSCLYGLTFGGFVGLSSFLTTYFHEQYHVSRVTAGDFAALVAIAGSLLRPVGGWLSDRVGGFRLLVGLLAGFGICLATAAARPSLAVAAGVLFVGMGLLGVGNGAVFQIVPQRFEARVGVVTGVIGAAGGLGGFFLPTLLGVVKDVTGDYAVGLYLFAFAFVLGTFALLELGAAWTTRWPRAAVLQTGVFSYRDALRRPAGEQVS